MLTKAFLPFKITVLVYFKMLFIPVMAKLNFQQLLLQSSVSNDPSEIILICWFGAEKTFLITNVEINVCLIFSKMH